MRIVAAFVVVAAIALAGCTTGDEGHHMDDMDGGHMDDDHHAAPDTGNLAYTGHEDVQWTVVAGAPDEFRYVPDTLVVEEGQTVGVTFRNGGTIPHELSIRDLGFHIHLDPGEEQQASFLADEAGTFVFGCYIAGHFENGMKGTIAVQPS